MRLKDANNFISSDKEGTDNPWCNQAVEISKISALGTPNEPLILSKVVDDC